MTNMIEETFSYMQKVIKDAVEKTERLHVINGLRTWVTSTKTLVVTYPGPLPERIVKLLDTLIEIYPAHLEYKLLEDGLSQYIISLSDEQDEVLQTYISTIHELNHTFILKKRVMIDLELQVIAGSEEDAEEVFESHISVLDPTLKVVCNNDALRDYTQEFFDVVDIE